MFKWIWNGKYFYAEHNSLIRADKNGDVYGGGGSKTTELQAAPVTPAPSPSETAAAQWQAQLQYQPELFRKWMESYSQYAPQVAGVDIGIQQQFAPQVRALQQEMFPQQTQLVEAMAGKALERLESPFAMTPEEEEAQTAIRQRAEDELTRAMRTRANIGGGLFGGRAAGTEERALSQMQQAFAGEDVARRLQAGVAATQMATPIAQILYPSMQQPQVPQFWQQPTPSADVLYNAYAQAAQPQYFTTGGGGGSMGGLGSFLGMLAGGLLAAPTGGMSIPMGAMLGGGVGGGLGSMWGR